ncbi:MAG TPA: thermonuclease family protein [Marinobacter sp.]|nr:thermonuclease family protein [Marinobacter sp.]
MFAFKWIIKTFLLVPFVLLGLPAAADCGFTRGLPKVAIASVADGDTLRTTTGDRLRLVGINTAELGRDGAADEPLARQARQAAQDFVNSSQTLYWRAAPGGKDRYGRLLGEIYNGAGSSLSAALLRSGLGFYIAVAPLPQWAACLQRAEDEARSANLGVWREPFWRARAASDLSAADTGFVRIQGRITHITVQAKLSWIELDGPVVLRLPVKLSTGQQREWQGRRVEVAAWLVDRSNSKAAKSGYKPLLVNLGDDSALRFTD